MNEERYNKVVDECKKLVISRNQQYGDSVDLISIQTCVELVIMKLSRIKQLGELHPKTLDELQDSINYLVFALEKYNNKETPKRKMNNCFTKEYCIRCKRIFKADRNYIYDTNEGYVCYDCVKGGQNVKSTFKN